MITTEPSAVRLDSGKTAASAGGSAMKVWLNGILMPVGEAKVSVLDRGFLYGDTIFETIVAVNGRLFKYRPHWERFCRSAESVGLILPFTETSLRDHLELVLRANGQLDGILRVSVSRGVGERGLSTMGCHQPTALILCFPPRVISKEMFEKGSKVIISSIRRIPNACLPAAAKTGNYLCGILAFREAQSAGASEAILLTQEGYVAEGTVSNVFIVQRGRLVTPPLEAGILPGITRAAIIEAAKSLSLTVAESMLNETDLYAADEVFYTNSSSGVMPVSRIGEQHFPCPGKVTRDLAEAYAGMLKETTE